MNKFTTNLRYFIFSRFYILDKHVLRGFNVNQSFSHCYSTRKNVSAMDKVGSIKRINNVNLYTKRSHTCGELRRENVGQKVTLCGWLKYQRMNKFILLRDSYGEIQLLFPVKDIGGQQILDQMPFESIIEVEGTVVLRPECMINKNQQTGDIEIEVEHFKMLNEARDNLPFNIREFQKAKEMLRMQYRYLDMRFPEMQKNLRMRSKLLMRMREFLIHNHFIDVETPTLFKATPGGAQEFIVPTRFPGKFYSLVQSPQQFKQMLMAGALDRYFQIARCYRDEGARSDRQPEFTQLDIELSFTDVECILTLIENLLSYTLSDDYATIPTHFPRMSYEDALENYGSDKPDISFDLKLQNCTDILKKSQHIGPIPDDFGAYLLVVDQKQHQAKATLTKSIKDAHLQISKQYQSAKFIQFKVLPNEGLSKLEKVFGTREINDLRKRFPVEEDSVLFLAYGEKHEARQLMGKIRLEYVNYLENKLGLSGIRRKGLSFLWVIDFPLFELNFEDGSLQSAHHPFTSPNLEDLPLLDSDPLKVRALAYDLVLNGNEVGGGSIRVHDPHLQEKILDLLGIDKGTLQHIIDMLGSGCPPHGGIALGLDRLLAILLNAESIREVMAFPKTFEGRDPVSQAPSEVSEETLNLYHIKVVNKDL
ncbi:hypothetical protein GWI33_015712 [Rhynchophorus ferrugineus]|uniref:Aminoacyl-transfer RNA synthetases class-II family profile domain-containing protein n=1 Tax=Rhynchophorus ferrugineus TaxID=354439 RepID=A0A834I277_RHYFE|nr:hypothetical protein GWI33_015712 [Rhynchophorus ferrugineus]